MSQNFSDYWVYKIYNIADFIALGLPSLNLTKNLEDIGEVAIMLTSGNRVGLVYDDVFLVINLNGNNPHFSEGHAVYLDDNDDIWLGVLKT